MTKLGAQGEYYDLWFTGRNQESSGTIDVLDWNSLIDRATITGMLVVPNVEIGKLEPLLKNFTDEEEKQMKRMFQRMDVLAKIGWHFQQCILLSVF